MGHSISAVVFRGAFDSNAANRLQRTSLPFPQNCTVIPLSAALIDGIMLLAKPLMAK